MTGNTKLALAATLILVCNAALILPTPTTETLWGFFLAAILEWLTEEDDFNAPGH